MNSASLVLGLQVLFGVEINSSGFKNGLTPFFFFCEVCCTNWQKFDIFIPHKDTYMLMMDILLFKKTSNLGVQGSPDSTIYHS